MPEEVSDYDRNANLVAKKYGLTMTVKYLGGVSNCFYGDSESSDVRDSFLCTLHREKHSMHVTFHESYAQTEKNNRSRIHPAPSLYDVLSCITKYEPEDTFDGFCIECGWEFHTEDEYKQLKKIYSAVKREYAGLCRLFPEGIPEDIQDIA